MNREAWDPAAFKRLYKSTPGIAPSVEWLKELHLNLSDLVAALDSYVTDLSGKPYSSSIRGDVSDRSGRAPWIFTYCEMEQCARRLEAQLNPDFNPGSPQFDEPRRGDYVEQIEGWKLDVENKLRRDIGWLIAYTEDLQDAMDWPEHPEGRTVIYAPNVGGREVCEKTGVVHIPCGKVDFRWPEVSHELRDRLAALAGRFGELSRRKPPRPRKEAGRTVDKETQQKRKLMNERWENYKDLHSCRPTYEHFTEWAVDKFDDMPTDDPAVVKRMIEAYRRTPSPNSLED